MHAISSYRGNRPTNKQTQTDRGDYNKLRRSFASAQCKNDFFYKIKDVTYVSYPQKFSFGGLWGTPGTRPNLEYSAE